MLLTACVRQISVPSKQIAWFRMGADIYQITRNFYILSPWSRITEYLRAEFTVVQTLLHQLSFICAFVRASLSYPDTEWILKIATEQ